MAPANQVTKFLVAHGIDAKASAIFLETDPFVQEKIMASGSLSGAKNPSSALLTRIRDVTSGSGQETNPALEQFIASNSLDERAADALRTAAPNVQESVLKRGDLGDCRNASAAVLGRLRDARASCAARANAVPAAAHIDVEEWCVTNNVDAESGATLKMCTPKVQQVVMNRGSLADTRNPAAVIMCRIKDAQKGIHTHSVEIVPPELVEQFIMENALDEICANSLRSCTPIVQKIVMNNKLQQDARNPSAVVLGRIKDANKARAKADANMSAGGGGGANMGGGGGGGGGADMMAMMTGMMGMMGQMVQASQQQQQPQMGMMQQPRAVQQPLMQMQGGNMDDMAAAVLGRLGAEQYGVDVEGFIGMSMLDALAAESLRNCTPDVQQAVIASGSLGDCRNPSAVVLARIKVAKMKAQVTGNVGGGNQMQQQMMQQQMMQQQAQQQQQQQIQQQQAQQQQQQQQMQGGQPDIATMMQGMMGMMSMMGGGGGFAGAGGNRGRTGPY